MDYRRLGWSVVPVPGGSKAPVTPGWGIREFGLEDFSPDCNVGLILGPRSGEIVDIDLDCAGALALAPLYLPETGAIFGRASNPMSHWLYTAPGAIYESLADPLSGETLVELRAQGRDGGAHQTVIPPSIADGERREWEGETIAPTAFDAAKLRRRVAYLAVACIVRRYVSEHAAERPGPDLPDLLYEADRKLGITAYRWLGRPDPDAPKCDLRLRSKLSREEIDLADLVHRIPNDCDWHEWNAIGMAIFSASGGSDQGGIVFDDWSAKSTKYDPYETSRRWRHYHRSPPNRIGMGTLVYRARQHGWPSKSNAN